MTSKHTPGRWEVGKPYISRYKEYIPINAVSPTGLKTAIATTAPIRNEATEEDKDNAKLMAEAGTVANDSGLTPMELLNNRNELLEALKAVQREINLDNTTCAEIVSAAIAKATI